MNEHELEEIEARARAATEGPWTVGGHFREYLVDGRFHDGETWPVAASPNGSHGATAWDESNAEFIAHARTDVPALLREVRRLRGIVAKQAHTAIADLAETYKTKLPCGHAHGDLIWAPNTVTKCGACLAERQAARGERQ